MTTEGRLVIAEDDRLLADQLSWALRGKFEVSLAADALQARERIGTEPDLFLFDLRLPPSCEPEEGLGLLQEVRQRCPEAAVVIMTGERDRKYALRAIELGASDFFRKPVDAAELQFVLARALDRQRLLRENRELREGMFSLGKFGKLVGRSAPMRALYQAIRRVAASDATVLIEGESGTGKELVAQSLHSESPRANGPFVAVNGSALPETLAESELFGHEKGSFTGAVASRPGKFELAHGGTLFLDEVATLSPGVQAKLLRAIETRQIERVGGRKPIPVDIRLIAASNEQLAARVAAGTFRQDLLFRLNTVTLQLPPLRERLEDLPLLVEFFASRAATRHGRGVKVFSTEALAALARHQWPGNVRELEHLVEMVTLMVEGNEVMPEHLPASFGQGSASPVSSAEPLPFHEAVAAFEKELLRQAISQAGGVKNTAARSLGLDTNQMKYLCRKHQL